MPFGDQESENQLKACKEGAISQGSRIQRREAKENLDINDEVTKSQIPI